MSRRGSGSLWPTPHQRLLLGAALAPGEAGRRAWEQWRASTDLRELDASSFRLLPLVYRNLSATAATDLEPLRGIYQTVWLKNQLLFSRIAAALSALHEAAIPTLLLKGAALALLYYRDAGARPMDDIDVLVPTSKAAQAIGLLRGRGWTPTDYAWNQCLDREMYLQVRHAQNLCDATGFEIDVHWHLCSRRWTLADDDADFWAESRPVTFRHVACRALAPTDLLFHVCLHATKWNSPDPGVLWVADASRIVRRCGDTIDWARLVAHAQRRGFGRPLGDALSYLRETVELPIPAEPLRALNGAWSSRIERLQYRMERRRPGPVTGFVLLGLWYRSYARSQPDRSPSRRLARLVEFLRCRWGTASVWKALPYLLAKLLRSWWPLPSRRPPDAGVWHERLTSMALRPPDAP